MEAEMTQSFVTFYSPGTFVAEETTKPIAAWNVDAAVVLARGITERHSARPYGFRFSTRARNSDELDSKQVAQSCMYYLGGRVETREQVFARNSSDERILRSNMEINGFDRIVVNDNSWRWAQPLKSDDVVLDVTL